MILSAQTIRKLCQTKTPLITPFSERGVFRGVSFGLSACGYDIRVREELHLRRGEFVLASSFEHFSIPNNLCMRVLDKSTWARRGLFCQNTIAEPGWHGFLTLELTLHEQYEIPHPVIEAGTAIAQVVFEQLDEPTELPYVGKYQDQPPEPVPAKFE